MNWKYQFGLHLRTNRSNLLIQKLLKQIKLDSYAKVMNADFIMSWSRKSKDKLNDTVSSHYEEQIWARWNYIPM